MGLDTVELVMEIEETFQIKISNREASETITVGQLYSTVLGKIAGASSQSCLSSAAFYRLRRGLVSLFGVTRKSVAPGAYLRAIFPEYHRRRNWQALGRNLDLRMPGLRRPFLVTGLVLVVFAAMLLIGLGGLLIKSTSWLPTCLVFGSFVFCWAAFKFTVPLAVVIPQNCSTIRNTVDSLLMLNFGKLAKAEKRWNEKEAWEALKAIIATQLGVSPQRVTHDARFVEDLGAD